jgi:hypothetical protein
VRGVRDWGFFHFCFCGATRGYYGGPSYYVCIRSILLALTSITQFTFKFQDSSSSNYSVCSPSLGSVADTYIFTHPVGTVPGSVRATESLRPWHHRPSDMDAWSQHCLSRGLQHKSLIHMKWLHKRLSALLRSCLPSSSYKESKQIGYEISLARDNSIIVYVLLAARRARLGKFNGSYVSLLQNGKYRCTGNFALPPGTHKGRNTPAHVRSSHIHQNTFYVHVCLFVCLFVYIHAKIISYLLSRQCLSRGFTRRTASMHHSITQVQYFTP